MFIRFFILICPNAYNTKRVVMDTNIVRVCFSLVFFFWLLLLFIAQENMKIKRGAKKNTKIRNLQVFFLFTLGFCFVVTFFSSSSSSSRSILRTRLKRNQEVFSLPIPSFACE